MVIFMKHLHHYSVTKVSILMSRFNYLKIKWLISNLLKSNWRWKLMAVNCVVNVAFFVHFIFSISLSKSTVKLNWKSWSLALISSHFLIRMCLKFLKNSPSDITLGNPWFIISIWMFLSFLWSAINFCEDTWSHWFTDKSTTIDTLKDNIQCVIVKMPKKVVENRTSRPCEKGLGGHIPEITFKF